jgi:hypothetical protein
MTYTAGQLILDDEYNIFVAGNATFGSLNHGVANLNTVWGEGFGDKGYGMTTILSQVTPGTVVTATQWQTLFDRVLAADDHQGNLMGGALPGDGGGGGPAETTGSLIEAIAGLQGNITSIFTNRLTSIATVATTVENSVNLVNWSNTATHTITVQFDGGGGITADDAVRYFFNAGGNITITAAMVGGTAAKVDPWDDGISIGIISEMGSVVLDAHSTVKVGGLGVDNTDYYIEDNIGYYELGTGDIQTFQQFLVGGGVYATNSLSINVKTNGVQGSNGDTGTIITFTVLLDDVVVSGDPVDGDTTVTATVNFPSAVYLTESPWKTVTTGSGVVLT